MKDPGKSLLSLLKFIGLLDDNGTVQWAWFLKPGDFTLAAPGIKLPNRHQHFKEFLESLSDDQSADLSAGKSWIPLNTGTVQAGPSWNSDEGTPLSIEFAASVKMPSPALKLTLVARLFEIGGGSINPEFGNFWFEGQFPVPGFLDSGTISGNILTKPGSDVNLILAAGNSQRTLSSKSGTVGWDCARLAAFVFEAWVNAQAESQPNDLLYPRFKHGFAMLGEPAVPIAAFPLFQPMGSDAGTGLSGWSNSVIDPAKGATGPLTFLLHLCGLLTGKQNPKIFDGSSFAPLISAAAADPLGNSYPPSPELPNPGAWLGVTDKDVAGKPMLPSFVLDLRDAKGLVKRIFLAQINPQTKAITTPPTTFANDQEWNNFKNWKAAGPFQAIAIAATNKPDTCKITLLDVTPKAIPGSPIPAGFDKSYKIEFVLQRDKAILFQASLSDLSLVFPPPNDLKTALDPLLTWIANSATSVPDVTRILAPIRALVQDFLQGAPAKPEVALDGILGILGILHSPIPVGPLTLTFIPGPQLNASFDFGPIDTEPTGNGLAAHIGKVHANIGLDLKSGGDIQHVSLEFDDLRLKNLAGGVAGVIGTLLPDTAGLQGVSLTVSWQKGRQWSITGGGKVAIQKTLGPVQINGLTVEVAKSISIKFDLTFKLSVIVITPYGLGVTLPFPSNQGAQPSPELTLDGLGISFDASGIKLAGMFARVGNDYLGGATVSVIDLFQLKAIGGYTRMADGTTSLFIFASIVFPFGGPPFCFIYGICGGFGLNRALPPTTLMGDHPFLRIMKDGLDLSDGIGPALQQLTGFAPLKDSYWIAAGLEFKSFGFIDGKIIVCVQFGHDFSFSLLGMASFALGPIAYFEIDILITADAHKFLLVASLSPHSYLIDPDIFSLQGSFALGVWYDNGGDFLLSAGGYHRYFNAPDYYPKLNRLSVKASLFGFVNLSVECFFAFTPHALMAGASVSLWGEFAGISAGLDVYIDVLLSWDPFFIRAEMGICLWFEILGRHEISVDLSMHTPPFGASAEVHLLFVSFTVEFGSDPDSNPTPSIPQFIQDSLRVSASPDGARAAMVNAFNDGTHTGLFHLDVLPLSVPRIPGSGRVPQGQNEAKQPPTAKQEGIDAKTPIKVAAEFSYSVRTRIPFAFTVDPPPATLVGPADLTLCNVSDLTSTLSVTPGTPNAGPAISLARRELLADFFPQAQFGTAPPSAQADAASQVASLDPKKPTIPLAEGIMFHCVARLEPGAAFPGDAATAADVVQQLTGRSEEFADPGEFYPLPLDWKLPTKLAYNTVKPTLSLAPAGLFKLVATPAVHMARRSAALAQMRSHVVPPLRVTSRSADIPWAHRLPRFRGETLAKIPANVAVIDPPASPPRRNEMFAIKLRILPIQSQTPVRNTRLRTLSRAVNLQLLTHTPPEGTRGPVSSSLTVATGRALSIDLIAGQTSQASLTLTGQQIVRCIFLGGHDAVLQDSYIAGSQKLLVSPAARRVVLIGCGLDAPLTSGPNAALQDNTGIQSHTALIALGRRLFAGHGCLAEARTFIGITPDPLDSLPGRDLFRAATNLRLSFPAAQGAACFVLIVRPNSANPGHAAEQVSWVTHHATLASLGIVIGPDRTALVMSLAASQSWSVDVDLGKDWRLAGVVVSSVTAAAMALRLASNANWDLVDDAFAPPPAAMITTVNLEIAQ